MGNSFEKESVSFRASCAQKLQPPIYISQLIQQRFRQPSQVHMFIKMMVEKYSRFSYLLSKKEFASLAETLFGLDPQDEGKKLYKMFKVKNPQGEKVVNVLEIVSVLIVHADFG